MKLMAQESGSGWPEGWILMITGSVVSSRDSCCPITRLMMNRMFALLILLFLPSGFAFSSEVREFYNGARSLGMGGASIAVVNDETALLTNPAALGKLRDAYGTIFDPEIDLSNNLSPMYNAKSFSNPWDLESTKDVTDASRETYYHARANLFPSFVAKNFGIGVFGKYLLDAEMNAAGTAMDTFFQDDLTLVLGINFRLFDGRIKIGASQRLISRIEINKLIDPTGSLTKADNAAEGAGIATDIGIILAAPWVLLPTVSAVVRDLGGTAFTAGSGLRMTTVERPQQVAQDIDVAVAIFPIHGNNTRSVFTAEYQKIKEASESSDKSRYYHLGYEFNYADLLFLRAGMNQKYWTAGLEIASEMTQIQLASYGEDVGAPGNSKEDRRYVFKFAFRY